MKLGLSSYSLNGAIRSGELTIVDAVRWVAEQGGEHIEIVPIGFSLIDDPDLADRIRQTAEEVGIELSGYLIGANFVTDSEEEFRARVDTVLRHVDIAARLGVTRMRHDAASRPIEDTSIRRFEEDLPKIAEACRTIADYAAARGITTSVENHGFYVQAADRVQRLIHAVDRANFRTTLDVGNFLCVDEDPVASVRKNVPYAAMVHLKDFYRRSSYLNPGEGWFRSSGGNYLRGAIVGQGDLDMREILRTIRSAGYDGYVSVEFEGMEECRKASRIALDNARRLWAEAGA